MCGLHRRFGLLHEVSGGSMRRGTSLFRSVQWLSLPQRPAPSYLSRGAVVMTQTPALWVWFLLLPFCLWLLKLPNTEAEEKAAGEVAVVAEAAAATVTVVAEVGVAVAAEIDSQCP